MTLITAERYHDVSFGHRVFGHESKCKHLHGHNYRITFTCVAEKLDAVGRVIDFSVMKDLLCEWLESHWDHRFLVFDQDPWAKTLQLLDPVGAVVVPFNPTAELLAEYLLLIVGPLQLRGTGVKLIGVRVEETRKCAAYAGGQL